ncbi:helicase-related protein [Epilithonimonas mollis]|uniref:helicase-related protein n=1 Tax=Epilithonimonas mollis TaxID=216903 RepID=UPI000932B253|nr:helicase-related protein [Epilithonimonas mollis]
MIRAALRSSHIALVEHIEGSQEAMDYFKFKGKSNHTGDKLKKLIELIELNKLPPRNNIFNKELFPSWLVNKEEYLNSCKQELEIYKKISSLAKKLSGQRELGKVEELVKNSQKHQNILAFDSTVITLYYLKKLFEEKYPNQKLLVASGSEKDNDSKKIMELFNLQSESTENCIALCSDKMSESIDLQKASSVVLLDLPSVLRIVEQRIGRVDRMDSLHHEIEIYWPDDSEEYSLKTDSRLIYTNDMVEDIFGSNFEIPTALKEKHFSQTNSTGSLIKEYKDFIDKDESWSGIHDSFQSVTELKEGKNALISEEIYEEFKDVSSEVKTRVSFIGSEKDWCFIALKGDKNKSPRWYFIDENNNIHTDFPDVCNSLRENIGKESKKLKWDDNSLHRFINLFKQKERDLLPPKKKRALDVAEYIPSKKLERKNINSNNILKQSIRDMLSILRPDSIDAVDYERLAEEWIEILQPFLNSKREQNKRKKVVLNLSSLKPDYNKIDLDIERINEMIENSTIVDEIDNKIASCIIGVSDVKSL